MVPTVPTSIPETALPYFPAEPNEPFVPVTSSPLEPEFTPDVYIPEVIYTPEPEGPTPIFPPSIEDEGNFEPTFPPEPITEAPSSDSDPEIPSIIIDSPSNLQDLPPQSTPDPEPESSNNIEDNITIDSITEELDSGYELN